MTQVKALIVDPDPDEHAVLRVLANRGTTSTDITSSRCYDEAAPLVAAHDVVLVGDHGPHRAGLAFIERVTSNGSDKPIIYFIDEEDAELATAALFAGADDVIPRPLLSSELLARSITFAIEHAANKRRMASQNHRTIALIEALPDLVLRVNAQGEVVDTYGHISAGPGASNATRPLGELVPSLVIDRMKETVARALSSCDLQIVEFSAGDDAELEARISPIRESQEAVVLIRDVTARNAQRRHLVETIESKDVILADVAHELRNPLASVIGFAQLLTVHGDTLTEDEVRDMLTRILAQANDIQGMVEDLLTAARQDIGKLVVASVRTSLNAQVAQVLESLPDIQADRISVTRGRGICIADPNRVRQICRNLVSNALKYGGENIWIRTAENGGIATLEVTDDGAGIPEDRIDQLFVRHAVDPAHRESVGLGLALSRDLAELMGGSLTYGRRDGKTSFRLSLPAGEASGVDVHGLDVVGVLLEDDPTLQLQ